MATCDIIDERSESAAEKERRKNHQTRLYIPFTMVDRTRSFNDQGYSMLFDPDENCQFAAVSFALLRFGIKRAAVGIRTKVAEYLNQNCVSPDGIHLELFVGVPL